MAFDELLKTARAKSGKTQSQLAERSGVAVPNISAIESGKRVPRFDTAEALLRSLGYRLLPIEIGRSTAWEVSTYIHEFLAEDDLGAVFRCWLQLNNDFVALGASSRYLLAVEAPAATGSAQWDAAIAALVEHRLNELNLPIPEWVSQAWRSLSEPESLVTYKGMKYQVSVEEAPAAFAKHNILFPEESLVSY